MLLTDFRVFYGKKYKGGVNAAGRNGREPRRLQVGEPGAAYLSDEALCIDVAGRDQIFEFTISRISTSIWLA